MFGLSALGAVHTAISLVAIVAGVWAFVRDKQILLANRLGQLYLLTTLLTAVTALMIFRHGGFRIGHQFAVATLVVLAIGTLAAATPLFGRASRYVQAVFYSSTMLIHMITGSAETLTRLPPGAPLVTAANAFIFKDIIGGLCLAFLIGLAIQLRWIQKRYSTDIPR
jgi:uncharacterized membrane protein